MTKIKSVPWTQAAVEQRTGLSREVLRKWELRYQFPIPLRGQRGQRQYSEHDVDRLHMISRLIKSGLRAGSVVGLPMGQLQTLLDARDHHHATPAGPCPAELESAVSTLLHLLSAQGKHAQVSGFLQTQLNSCGLAVFVAYQMPAFNAAVGEAWLTGLISVAAEHHYTENLQNVVRSALPSPGHNTRLPTVLLTTPPGELHILGLLGLQAHLSLQGAACINLGPQTPLTDVVQTAHAEQVGVVAISASAALPGPDLQSYFQTLRMQLPAHCEVWAGGQGSCLLRTNEIPGCTVFGTTTDAVQHWLARAKHTKTTD